MHERTNRFHPGTIQMPTFNDNFGFKESPFEQYVAEREPRINEYAVKPPYFEETKRRISSVSSYILFGSRGSGKSATRITAEKEAWKEISKGAAGPLMVSFTDFDQLLKIKNPDSVTLRDVVERVAFITIETLLLWISNQQEKEQIIDLLDDNELRNLVVFAKAYYLCVPEGDRVLSQSEAMKILQQNWGNKTFDWINKKWSNISAIIGVISSALMKSKFQTEDISKDISSLLQLDGTAQSSRTLLGKLVDIARTFGFTGVCVLIDKVDEHAKTQRSTESTAHLVYPIVSQVQIMEIDGFSWIFFLWDKVKILLSTDKLFTRLDKYAHSDVSWSKEFLEIMIKNRLSFFSGDRISSFNELCDVGVDANSYLDDSMSLVQRSPRELVRLLDVLTREFNANYAHLPEPRKLCDSDFEIAQDVYVRDVLWTVYDNKILSQLLRFNTSPFTNKDVQQAFKISPASARGRIQSWEACGAVSLSGTRAPEGEAGGKPANEYSIVDPRIRRMAERTLYDQERLTESPIDDEI